MQTAAARSGSPCRFKSSPFANVYRTVSPHPNLGHNLPVALQGLQCSALVEPETSVQTLAARSSQNYLEAK